MPLVISQKTKEKSYILSTEILAELLGHSNFDGENWSVGDLIIFEDQTSATIERHVDGFHIWSEPKPIELINVKQNISKFDSEFTKDIQTWEQLFSSENYPKPFQKTIFKEISAGIFVVTIVFVVVGALFLLIKTLT